MSPPLLVLVLPPVPTDWVETDFANFKLLTVLRPQLFRLITTSYTCINPPISLRIVKTVAFNSLSAAPHLPSLTCSQSKKKPRTKGAHLVYKKKWWSSWRQPPRLPFSGDTSVGRGGNIVISQPDKAPPEGAATRRHPQRRPNRKILSAPSSEPAGPSTLNAPCGGRAEPSLTFTGQVWDEQVEPSRLPLGRGLMLEVRGRSWNAAALFLKKLSKTFPANIVKSRLRWFMKWQSTLNWLPFQFKRLK